MRIDKFLQVSRIIKRRAIAKEVVEKQRVSINGKVAKPSSLINIDDNIKIEFGDTTLEIRVLSISDKVKKDQIEEVYEIIRKGENKK